MMTVILKTVSSIRTPFCAHQEPMQALRGQRGIGKSCLRGMRQWGKGEGQGGGGGANSHMGEVKCMTAEPLNCHLLDQANHAHL